MCIRDSNNINKDLINDIWYKDIDYIFRYFEVVDRKELEKKYIRHFINKNKSLYNKKLYTKNTKTTT